MAAPWGCVVLLLVSASLHQQSEAVPKRDVDQAFLEYSLEFDDCKDISDSSPKDSEKAADDACQQAFFALDRLRQNTCQNWRDARCRLISGQIYRQCSCLVSYYNDGNFSAIPFRACAKNIVSEDPSTRVEVPQSKKRRRSKRDSAHKSSRRRYASINSQASSGVGISISPYSSSRAGSSEGVPIGSSAGSSSVVQTAGSSASLNFPVDPTEGSTFARFFCPNCPKSYVYDRTLREHIKSHGTNETKCPVCPQTFSLKSNLRVHIRRAHPGTPIPEKARPRIKEKGPFICGECGRNYTTRNILQNHAKSHGTLETHCFRCKLTFSSRGNYRSHLREQHPEDAIALEGAEEKRYIEEKPVECGMCDRRFKNTDGLRVHWRVHAGKTTCDVCGAVFAETSTLNIHKAKAHQN